MAAKLTPANGCQILGFSGTQWDALSPALQEWLRNRTWRNHVDHYSRRGPDGQREYLSVIQLEVANADAEAFLNHISSPPFAAQGNERKT